MTFRFGKLKLLSMPESSSPPSLPTAQDAAEALAAVDQTRRTVARSIVTPPGYEVSYAVAVALTVLASGLVGAFDEGLWARILVPVMFLIADGLFFWQLALFRKANGVSISAYRPRIARRYAVMFSVCVVLLMLGSLSAGVSGLWGLVVVCAALGVLFGVASSRAWIAGVRREFGAC